MKELHWNYHAIIRSFKYCNYGPRIESDDLVPDIVFLVGPKIESDDRDFCIAFLLGPKIESVDFVFCKVFLSFVVIEYDALPNESSSIPLLRLISLLTVLLKSGMVVAYTIGLTHELKSTSNRAMTVNSNYKIENKKLV